MKFRAKLSNCLVLLFLVICMLVPSNTWAQQKCTPSIKFYPFLGNVGNDKDRELGAVEQVGPTNLPKGDFKVVSTFTFYTFDITVDGQKRTTIIGDPAAVQDPTKRSWVKMKIDDTSMAVEWWFNHVSVGTGEQNDLTGGAFEGRILLVKNANGKWQIRELWSTPEGFTIQGKFGPVNFGTFLFPGAPSKMYTGPTTEVVESWGGDNLLHADFLTLEDCGKLIWQPFWMELIQHGSGQPHPSGLNFNVGYAIINTCP